MSDWLGRLVGPVACCGTRHAGLWCRPSHDAVGAHPSQHLDREAGQEVGHARCVVAGVEDDEDVAVADVPAAHLDHVLDHAAELGGGDLGDVVLRAETDGVQQLAPGCPTRFEGGDEGVRPAGDELWSEDRPLRP